MKERRARAERRTKLRNSQKNSSYCEINQSQEDCHRIKLSVNRNKVNKENKKRVRKEFNESKSLKVGELQTRIVYA